MRSDWMPTWKGPVSCTIQGKVPGLSAFEVTPADGVGFTLMLGSMHTIEAHGANIPALGFGTFRLTGDEATRAVGHALSIGYRHIDTAQVYRNEEEVGRAIRESEVRRGEVFLTTKVWVDQFARADLPRSVDASLRRLGTDYLDLLLLHWPNPKIALEETLGALRVVKSAGKARHVGVSNFPTHLLREALEISEVPLATNQVEYHPYLDQTEVLRVARSAGMALTAYSPIARGQVMEDPLLDQIGSRYGKSAAQVSIRWLIQQDGVAAIPKAGGGRHREENLDVLDFSLTPEEMVAIHALARTDGRQVDPEGLAPKWD